mgnify:CR=1 FL=1
MNIDKLLKAIIYVLIALLVATILAIGLELIKWICPILLAPMLFVELIYLGYKFYKEGEDEDKDEDN